MIEYDHGDQILAVLLRSSHCGGNHWTAAQTPSGAGLQRLPRAITSRS